MLDNSFQKAEKSAWYDKILAVTVLKLLPAKVLPNHVTVFRFITTPIVAVLMLYEHYLIGLIAFLLVAFTDAIDGAMARTRNQITEWGKAYDPLADKILIGSMVFIIVLRYIDFWTAMIIVVILLLAIVFNWQALLPLASGVLYLAIAFAIVSLLTYGI